MLRVVRTRRVRAIDERYYGRTARMFYVGVVNRPGDDETQVHANALSVAAAESVPAHKADQLRTSLRHARLPAQRAAEFWERVEVRRPRVRAVAPRRRHRVRLRCRSLPDRLSDLARPDRRCRRGLRGAELAGIAHQPILVATSAAIARARAVRGRRIPSRPPNRRCASRAAAKASTKPSVAQRIEARLPTTARGRAGRRPCGRCAARSGRRTDRRSGAAARSSPSGAWPRERRPPRGSRNRRAAGGGHGPRRAGRGRRGTRAPGATPPGRPPAAISRRACSRMRQLARHDVALAPKPLDVDRGEPAGLDQVSPQALPLAALRRPEPHPQLGLAGLPEQAVGPVAGEQPNLSCSSSVCRSARRSAGKRRSERS